MSSDAAVVVARFTWRHEAEFAAGYLADAGIHHSVLVDDHAGHVTMNNTARVLVAPSDAEQAREVLRTAGLENT